MRFHSLKSKLLAGVCVLVIGSGALISSLVAQRYSKGLLEALSAQAEYLTHAVSLEAADMVLTNDLVALQKMLDHQLRSHPSLAYLLVLKDGRVLAHTFTEGIPADLIAANDVTAGMQPHLQEIVSHARQRYLDMAMPIFEGKAGILRLGFSEEPYRRQVNRLWLQMVLLTLGILLLAVCGGLWFVRRITGPIMELARAVGRVDRGELDVTVGIAGRDEVAHLAASFNQMIQRLRSYTGRLEEQTMELERAHHQTRTFCGIVQQIGALKTFREIGMFLIRRFHSSLDCGRMLFLILNQEHSGLFLLTDDGEGSSRDPELIEDLVRTLKRLEKPAPFTGSFPNLPELARDFQSGRRLLVPLVHQKQPFGGLLISCPENCSCKDEDVQWIHLIVDQAAGVVQRAILHEQEIRELQGRLGSSAEFWGMVAKDVKMQMIFKLIEDIAPTDATVLIQGESGTGKELVARAIHQLGPRKEKPFIVINCAAYPASLLESELFGHEKGAFSGAIRLKPGRFEQAHGGTVFLDEIGEIPPTAQIKLLRVLQTREFERVGGEKTLSVDVRILAATNKDLLAEVRKGNFREDLYYRLKVIPIHLPALRERRNDIPLLARHFLHRFSSDHEKNIASFSPDAIRVLLNHPWPGNVRELENTIEHAVVLAKDRQVEISDLPGGLRTETSEEKSPELAAHEKQLLEKILSECNWNKKEAATRLGISRNTLYNKLKKYRIQKSEPL
jgi:two-component system response regulator HydG